MFYRMTILLSFMLIGVNALACDVCGCSVSSNGVGLLSAYQYNTVGVRWFSTHFKQHPDFGNTKDNFEALDIYAQWRFKNRFRLSVFQPYKWHVRNTEDVTTSINGLGDTRLLLNYALLNNLKLTNGNSIYWELGGGVKLPTGKFNPQIHRTGLPENFNLGNGSWAFTVQSNLVYNFSKIGIISFTNYQYNLVSSSDYHFGGQFSNILAVFAQNSITRKFKTIPHAGFYFEQVGKDKLYNGNHAHGTGGHGLFASGGINFVVKDFLISSSFMLPIKGNYGEQEILVKPRVALEMAYIF